MKTITLIITLIILMLIACTSYGITEEEARILAEEELQKLSDFTEDDLWNEESEIGASYPIYIDGISEISYYEFKVITNGSDAGYILVNVNQTDLMVPESAISGKTLTEQYEELLGHSKFKLLRYDHIRNIAVDDNNNILASMGFTIPSTPEEGGVLKKALPPESIDNIKPLTSFRDLVLDKGCIPSYDQDMLQYYYKNEQVLRKSAGIPNVLVDKVQLSNKFSCGWHTPKWSQIDKNNGYPVGCGNTAWAITYAYWKQFKGKQYLFDGNDISNKCNDSDSDFEPVKNCMLDCADYTNTIDIDLFGKQGMTLPANLSSGIAYATYKGYGNSYCNSYALDLYSFLELVPIWLGLKKNRPVILLISTSKLNDIIPNHYVVVEGARITRNPDWAIFLFGADIEIQYLCNYGWGDTRKWITVWASSFFTFDNEAWMGYVPNIEGAASYTVSQDISDGEIHDINSLDKIIFENKISNSSVVYAKTGQKIIFKPGFHIYTGSYLVAKLR